MARRLSHTTRFVLIGIGVAGLTAAALKAVSSLSLPALALASLSLATFALYGYDKQMARTGGFRVPENALHILAIAGGSPGALLGQRVFRHKTAKRSFQVAFWLILLMQVGLLVWWQRGLSVRS